MLWFLVQQKLWRITRQLQVFLFLNRSHHRFPHLLRFRQMMLSRAPQPVVRNMISDATFVAIAAICGQDFPSIWIHTREQSPFNAKSVCSLSHNHKICMFTAKPIPRQNSNAISAPKCSHWKGAEMLTWTSTSEQGHSSVSSATRGLAAEVVLFNIVGSIVPQSKLYFTLFVVLNCRSHLFRCQGQLHLSSNPQIQQQQ